jgi:flagellar motor switch protein FliG
MKRSKLIFVVGSAVALLGALAGPARADHKPPFGNDAGLLEQRVREDIERRVAPLLDQMAPGQADLVYIDVRVNRPTALATGTNPGFEDLGPGADYVAERAEITLQLDAKLPANFRKDLKTLIQGRLEALAVPIQIKERVFTFPTPRPQAPPPREPMPYYQQAPAPPPPPAPKEPEAAAEKAHAPPPAPAGLPTWVVVALVVGGLLLLACLVALVLLLVGRRRARKEAGAGAGKPDAAKAPAGRTAALAGLSPDRLPEVRRALTEDRVLARRVLSELLLQNEFDKVARTVELVGPTVVDDLRTDPNHALPLREAAARLDSSRPATAEESKELGEELYRRVLKHRMMGAGDPVEQEFAFLVGLPAVRFAAILRGERPAAQAAALRYAPNHLRAAYLADCPIDERAALVAALADGKSSNKDYLFDVAATLRARAVDHAHIGSGEASDVELLVEMIEEAASDERARLLDAMGRSDPEKRARVQALLLTDQAVAEVAPAVLGAASLSVTQETLARFLRGASAEVASRVLAALPVGVAAALREELSLEVPIPPDAVVEARRAVHRALRRALRDRGLTLPAATAEASGRKVVAL